MNTILKCLLFGFFTAVSLSTLAATCTEATIRDDCSQLRKICEAGRQRVCNLVCSYSDRLPGHGRGVCLLKKIDLQCIKAPCPKAACPSGTIEITRTTSDKSRNYCVVNDIRKSNSLENANDIIRGKKAPSGRK